MRPWYDCCERLLMGAVPVEKKTPIPSEDIMEKLKACFNEPDDLPCLESRMKSAMLDSDRFELTEKLHAPQSESDTTLGRLYGELMGQRRADADAIFQSALDKGHVLWVQYQMDPGKFTVKFIDHSIIVLTEPMPVQNLYDIWMAWYGQQFDESLSDMNQFSEKRRIEFMNASYLYDTALDRKARTIPEVKLIQRRGRCTIVKWEDGTETKVVLEEGKPDTGIFGAYCIALAKKCAGSTDKLLRTIDDHDERVIKCRYQAKLQEIRERHRKERLRARKLKWETDVAAAMYDSRVRDEAIKRLWANQEKEDI